MAKRRKLYRVKFQDRNEKAATTLVVSTFGPSDYPGLLTLEGFVWYDQTRFVVLPEEDEVHKRYAKTERLHLPFHCLLSVEEFLEEDPDLKNLPFIREVPPGSEGGPA